ncbi:MAG: putative chitinase [Ignavibacteria bacterium]|nr:MAG: putative chitinase [Ignavibacteria bacterium]KAF0153669.1 MAG: putative chitinase [Ignavibacteria bacterium]
MFSLQYKFINLTPKHLQEHFKETIEKYSINTVFRCAHFLSQIMHESGDFKFKEENLNYSENGLLLTFSKYFNKDNVKDYARKPEKIANRVYANRMGNGNEESGDGYNYRGRGFIQITGRSNYLKAMQSLGLSNPDQLKEDRYAMLSAGWFWDSNRINLIADKGLTDDVIKEVTKKINGGYIGLTDRTEKLNEICEKVQVSRG